MSQALKFTRFDLAFITYVNVSDSAYQFKVHKIDKLKIGLDTTPTKCKLPALLFHCTKHAIKVKNSSPPLTVGRLITNGLLTGHQQVTDRLPTVG